MLSTLIISTAKSANEWHMYFVFNTSDHVITLTGHFDGLIRAAEVQAHQLKDWIDQLIIEIRH